MSERRSVEHYKGHELIAEASTIGAQWKYVVSIISHDGDDSAVSAEESEATFHSDLEALAAGTHRGRAIIDELVVTEGD